jgi:predicted membrane-bound spermidine synthase
VYLRAGLLDRERLDSGLAFYGLLFAVSIPLSFYFYLYLGVRGVLEWFGISSELAIVEAALEYALLAVPFFAAGVCIALLLLHGARESNRLYAADLGASATGAVLVIPALAIFGGPKSMLFASLVAGAATLPFRGGLRRGRWAAPVVLAAALVGLVGLPASSFNELRLRKSSTMIAREPILWNAFSMVGVAPEERILGVYRSRLIIIDNNVGTEMVGFSGSPAQLQMLRRDFSAPAHRIRRDADVLIIGSGGGRDIRIALTYGQRHVRVVEVNPLVVQMANEIFGDFTGHVYDERKVQTVVGDARSYIANSEERFDIILASLIDTAAASAAGAFALTENLLYTTDAFRDYYEHLTDDGVLSVSRWHPVETSRLLATGLETWREVGVEDPRKHAVVFIRRAGRILPIVTLLMKRSPFTSEEIRVLEEFAAETGVRMALSPSRVDDPVVAKYLAEGVGPWEGVDVDPVPDDRPFYFNRVKPFTQVKRALSGRGASPGRWPQISGDATRVLVQLFLAVTLLVVFTILAPLLLRAGAAPKRSGFSLLGYFACLGLGYILIEVGLLQRLILLLGKPVHALAVILSTMLLASGSGSLASGRFTPERLRQRLPSLLLLVAVILALYTFLLPGWIHALLGSPFVARVASAVMLVALPAFLLGMPFPSGLRVLEDRDRTHLVPWVWGVNGAMSVMASVGGMILAIQFGYTVVFLLGTACYFAAAFLFRIWAAEPAR